MHGYDPRNLYRPCPNGARPDDRRSVQEPRSGQDLALALSLPRPGAQVVRDGKVYTIEAWPASLTRREGAEARVLPW